MRCLLFWRHFMKEVGKLFTSHPLLDDNSDGIGHENGDMGTDGDLASVTYL